MSAEIPQASVPVTTREMSPRRVSFLCVTHNRKELLLRCLDSCEGQTHPLTEMIVIDNASDDGTVTAIRSRFPDAKIISMHRNIGFFPALNVAVANSSGDYLMTVDDDACFLQKDAIATLARALDSDPMLGAVTCNIEGPREEPLAVEDQDVHTFKTGFTMIRREVFDEWVGYYPDLFFRAAGEAYLSTTLWDIGRSVRRLADVRMHHDATMQSRNTWNWGYHGVRSQILLVFMRSPWWMIPPSLLAKCMNGFFHFARIGRLREWASAWCCVWVSVPNALRYRRPIRWSTQRKLWKLRRMQHAGRLNPEAARTIKCEARSSSQVSCERHFDRQPPRRPNSN